MSPAKKRFAVPSGLPPTADEAPAVPAPGRQDAQTPAKAAKVAAARTAFTWRLTADQALMMDDMLLRLKRQLGRPKLDRAGMLAELVALADDNPGVFGALAARMQEEQTS